MGESVSEAEVASGEVLEQPWKHAVGYLKGRGGAGTVSCGETQDEWRAVFAGLRAKLDELEVEALGVEAAMELTAKALYRSQPPMYHRVAVRWWRLHGGSRREPVLVRIESGANGRLKSVRVGRGIKLRADRGFGLCVDLARRGVRAYWALLGLRKEVSAQVADVSRVLSRTAVRRINAVGKLSAEMEQARLEAEERLREVGYDIQAAEEADDGSGFAEEAVLGE